MDWPSFGQRGGVLEPWRRATEEARSVATVARDIPAGYATWRGEAGVAWRDVAGEAWRGGTSVARRSSAEGLVGVDVGSSKASVDRVLRGGLLRGPELLEKELVGGEAVWSSLQRPENFAFCPRVDEDLPWALSSLLSADLRVGVEEGLLEVADGLVEGLGLLGGLRLRVRDPGLPGEEGVHVDGVLDLRRLGLLGLDGGGHLVQEQRLVLALAVCRGKKG